MMKSTNSKIILVSLITVFMVLFSSCEKDNPEVYEEDQKSIETNAKSEREPQTASYCSATDRSSCDDNLINDGCIFTSGEGRDTVYRYTMVNLLDNCHTESLPSNCSWYQNITQTRDIYIDLTNCCYPAYALNAQMENWKNLAIANKPDASYLITDYQYINGFMVTSLGPYRIRVRVTYRKKICSIGTVDVIRR